MLADLPTRHPRQAEFAQGEHFLRIASDGTILNPVLDLPASEHVLEVPQEAVTTQVPIPFSADPLWGMAPGGSRMVLVTTARNAYRVQILDSNGDTLAVRDLLHDRIPIPREVVDSTVQSRAAKASNDRIRTAVLEKMADLIPRAYPPVFSVLVGSDQRIWLQIREGPDKTAWLVLSPEAEPVGRLSLPVNVWLMAADATHLCGTETDEVGVQSVVRYRLAPGA